MISEGTTLVTWRGIRHIRASFPTTAQVLYSLMSNVFSLWNWSTLDLSYPYLSVRLLFQQFQTMYYGSALVHIAIRSNLLIDGYGSALSRILIDASGCLAWTYRGSITWDAVKQSFDLGADSLRAQTEVFLHARDLGRFFVSTTFHVIWSSTPPPAWTIRLCHRRYAQSEAGPSSRRSVRWFCGYILTWRETNKTRFASNVDLG